MGNGIGYPLPIDEMHTLVKKLGDALKDASEHLDYCGYGDSYERSCATDRPQPLDVQIEEAVGAYAEYCK